MERILRVRKEVVGPFNKGQEVCMVFGEHPEMAIVESYEARELHDRTVHVLVVVSGERMLCCVFLNDRSHGLAGDPLLDGPRMASHLERIPLQRPVSNCEIAYGWGV